MLDGSLFALKYLPPNEESRSSGRQGIAFARPIAVRPCKQFGREILHRGHYAIFAEQDGPAE